MPGGGGRAVSRAGSAGRRAAAAVLLFSVGGGPGSAFLARRAAAGPAPFWERAAEPGRDRTARLLVEAEGLLEGSGSAGRDAASQATRLRAAESLVREVLARAPDDHRALLMLAEIEARAGHAAASIAALEQACPRAPRGRELSSCWFRLGVERSRAGQLAPALAAYERLIALGAGDAATYGNAAELLMALGRLGEAEDRYREAIRLEEQTAPAGRMEGAAGLAFSTYGLAVALDRAGRAAPAREMMARALALDPRLARLRAAERAGGEVFFLPDGDVFYYIGLASEVAGRVDDAEAAFQEFLSRLPRSPYAPRARAHVDAMVALERAGAARGAPGSSSPASSLRVVAAGTVLASGPVPAPLVDAAWRTRADLLDACLDEGVQRGALPARGSFRFALEIEIDGRGAVTAASAKAAAPLDETFARCAEAAVRAGLRLPRPQKARPTHARIDLLVATKDPGGV
jgi:tetratricopeptide (TPR) repeat protein